MGAEADRMLAAESQLPEKLVRKLRGLLDDERMREKLGIPTEEEPMTARLFDAQSAIRQSAKVRQTAICRTCKACYLVDENSRVACKTHPGYWKVAPNKGRSAAVANAARAIIAGKSGMRYRLDEVADVGIWSCCKSRDKNDPGCQIQFHIPADDTH